MTEKIPTTATVEMHSESAVQMPEPILEPESSTGDDTQELVIVVRCDDEFRDVIANNEGN